MLNLYFKTNLLFKSLTKRFYSAETNNSYSPSFPKSVQRDLGKASIIFDELSEKFKKSSVINNKTQMDL
jgi:hypothetical protein